MPFTPSLRDVLTAKTYGSYYYEDVVTLQHTAVVESERWFTPSQTEGFKTVREMAETISVGLVSPVHVAWGDCVGVSYAGKSGRRHVLRHDQTQAIIEKTIVPWLRETQIISLRDFDLRWKDFEKRQEESFHPALAYGLSQAVLHFITPDGALFRTIAKEWCLSDQKLSPLPLQGSSGNNRYDNADKMIVRRLAALPHSQVDHRESQVGKDGEVLLSYVAWLKDRIRRLGDATYRPVIHLDVHGAVGAIFANRVNAIVDFLVRIHETLDGLAFRMESVALADSKEGQISLYAAIKNELARRNSPVWIVADEWANTLEDIKMFADSGCVHMIHLKTPDVGSLVDIVDATLHCKAKKMPVLLGGSCIETALSTRATIHLGMVTRPEMVLIKPGMGIDEGYMLCQGEMARIEAESHGSGLR